MKRIEHDDLLLIQQVRVVSLPVVPDAFRYPAQLSGCRSRDRSLSIVALETRQEQSSRARTHQPKLLSAEFE